MASMRGTHSAETYSHIARPTRHRRRRKQPHQRVRHPGPVQSRHQQHIRPEPADVGNRSNVNPQTYTIANFAGGITGFSNGTDISSLFTLSGTLQGPPRRMLWLTPAPAAARPGDPVDVFPPVAVAGPFTWTGTVSGNWSNGSNWTRRRYRGSSANTQLTFGATPNADHDQRHRRAHSSTHDLQRRLAGLHAGGAGGNWLNFVTNGSGALPHHCLELVQQRHDQRPADADQQPDA